MSGSRLHWTRGRQEDGVGVPPRTLEWIGYNDAGEPIARVIHIQGLSCREATDPKVIELRPTTPPDGSDWLACLGGQIVARSTLPMRAMRAVETALSGQ